MMRWLVGLVLVGCGPDPRGALDANGAVSDGGTACSPETLGTSYVGCEYYPTVTGNLVLEQFPFAVTIANTTDEVATVTIEGGALSSPRVISVEPNGVGVERLPWVTGLRMCTGVGVAEVECGPAQTWGGLYAKGAYRVRSTVPVTVYQFNPLDYTDGQGKFSYSNDASLLLPANALGRRYIIASWPAWPLPWPVGTSHPGILAVTATVDNTTVAITPTAPTMAGVNTAAIPAGELTTFVLNRGDVIELSNSEGDLTGSVVEADQPVQVISGHYCTQIPFGVQACDHIEESQLPVEILGIQYAAVAPVLPGKVTGKVRTLRIIATEPDTQVAFDPPIPGTRTDLVNVGDVIEVAGKRGDFIITANRKIIVAQYMEGQRAEGDAGDPAMSIAVPIEQYRTSYLFHAPISYPDNYVDITAPVGAKIKLDGAFVGTLTPIGQSGIGFTRARLSSSSGGNHRAEGDQAFGISVYGYGTFTSYWYPGGLDLVPIIK